MNPIRPLQLKRPKNTTLPVPGHDPWHVSLGDPAMAAMTDFHERAAVTIGAYAPIDAALDHMKHAGVRAALVEEEPQGQVVGMITAYDILGEKPMLHLQAIGCTPSTCSRDDVRVRDIMEKVADWQVVDMQDVEMATVGQMVELFRSGSRTHIAVMQTSAAHGERLRGLFSAAKISRLVGIASVTPLQLPQQIDTAWQDAKLFRRSSDIPGLAVWQRLSAKPQPRPAGS